ncbi:N,N-dimethylaniline monooxygenase Ecym_5104 [Eremothecium cymbalariae DBVPG|uniref:FAD/NAD(P)-binding domain-containing protein n=1 Tax=Eremothecium cymbalariae (strain CBS 270.75 / DBVPG 7215 / KCTC 17166 / NRRL Y-17582) TaxID=931890 RepID=I6NCU5_ERECY|nr:hypothetical protein Ecym_5104 [Eremothecium cymbalariae DBVPG\
MPKNVAIIGAGPAGLGTARALLNNTPFEVTIFEQADQIGGLWYYGNGLRDSSMYDHLETNLMKQIMAFNGFPFPEYDPTFPSRQRVWEYLRLYFLEFIKGKAKVFLNNKVTSLEKVKEPQKWELRVENGQVYTFDFVVIANGHYVKGYTPQNIPGLDKWRAKSPEASVHSKWFTNSAYARGKTIVVVGNGVSGQDIANQLSTVAYKVYHSVRNVSSTEWPSESVIEAVGVITEINPETSTITFDTGDIVHNVDQIIWATGYRYDIPFLKSYRDILFPNDGLNGADKIHNLWENLVFTRDPTLSFPLLVKGVVTFPVAEMHGCLICQVYNGKITREEMSYGNNCQSVDIDFKSCADMDYCKRLNEILDTHHSSRDKFEPVRWDKNMIKMRGVTAELKKLRTVELLHRAINLRKIGISYTL